MNKIKGLSVLDIMFYIIFFIIILIAFLAFGYDDSIMTFEDTYVYSQIYDFFLSLAKIMLLIRIAYFLKKISNSYQ